jgi:hypothetical protein
VLTIPALVVLVAAFDVRDARRWGFGGGVGWEAVVFELVGLAAFAALLVVGRRVKPAAVTLIALAPVGFVVVGLGGGDPAALDTIAVFVLLSVAPLVAGLMLLAAHLLDGEKLISEQNLHGLMYAVGGLFLLVGGSLLLFDAVDASAAVWLAIGAVLVLGAHGLARRTARLHRRR